MYALVQGLHASHKTLSWKRKNLNWNKRPVKEVKTPYILIFIISPFLIHVKFTDFEWWKKMF